MGTDSAIVVGAIPGLVVLGCVRKQTKQAMGSMGAGSGAALGSCPVSALVLTSFHDEQCYGRLAK